MCPGLRFPIPGQRPFRDSAWPSTALRSSGTVIASLLLSRHLPVAYGTVPCTQSGVPRASYLLWLERVTSCARRALSSLGSQTHSGCGDFSLCRTKSQAAVAQQIHSGTGKLQAV